MRGLEPLFWIVIALLTLGPLAASILDVMRGRMRGSLHNIAAGYLLYAFRVFFLLIAQFTIIPILFLVGPVWMFAMFLTIADLIARWGSNTESAGIPMLCEWFDIAPAYCWLILLIYHIASGVLAYAILRYGKRVFEILAGWYWRGSEWLVGQIQP